MIDPCAEVLPEVVQNAETEDQTPNLPRRILEHNDKGLFLQKDAEATCQGGRQRVVPLYHDDRKTLKTARCHKCQCLSKHANNREYKPKLVTFNVSVIGLRDGHLLAHANETDATKGTNHADDLDKRDQLLEPQAGQDGHDEGAGVHDHKEDAQRQVLDREHESKEADGSRDAPDEQNHSLARLIVGDDFLQDASLIRAPQVEG